MSLSGPLQKSKDEYKDVIDRIASEKSAVGIDAQLTHAIIIDYLEQISKRLERLENSLQK